MNLAHLRRTLAVAATLLPLALLPESVAIADAGATPAVVAPAVAPATAPLSAPAPSTPPVAWEKVREDDGIIVQRREIAGSPIIAFRGEGTINAPLIKVGSVLVDIARSPEWIDSLKEAKLLRKLSEVEYVAYNHIATPIVMKDRDFVVATKLEVDPKSKRFIIHIRSVTDPTAPANGYVRGEISSSAFELTAIDGGKRTKIVTEIHCDPKGSVANWIVNMFQKKWPYNTIMSLRTQVAKPDIKDHPQLVAVLAQTGFYN